METGAELARLFGNPPYPYQLRVAQALLAGRNVILRVPTGGGKTEAALGPFLVARARKDETFPLRAILASPMRTLAKDLHGRAQAYGVSLGLDVRLHTGEDPAAPLLEGDIIVTTVDQLLSNYLHVPYSMSAGRRNIGAGGVMSSYVVLDEFHLFDPKRAFRTTLMMAAELRGITPFLFMTATFSEELTRELATYTDAVVILPTREEFLTMPSQRKTRTFRRVDASLTAQAVAAAHGRRSIAIANTVPRVQALFEELQRLQRGEHLTGDEQAFHRNLQGVTLEMLHSRYFPSDRNEREARLAALLKKGSWENVILVASQAVEVGLNISCERLHTEVCPANSLLQRAGRCARFEGEVGEVLVYDLPTDEQGRWSVLPYQGQEDVLRNTWEALETLPAPITVSAEQALIDAVHTPGDRKNWKDFEFVRSSTFRQLVNSARNDGERGLRPELIRDIQNVSVLLHPHPDDIRSWHDLNEYERLSVFNLSLADLEEARRQADPAFHDDWLVKSPREEGEVERGQRARLRWDEVANQEQIRKEPLVAVNPRFVFYNGREGLRLDRPGPAEAHSPRYRRQETGERGDYWYTFETYREHIENVMRASRGVAADVWQTCPKVDARFHLPPGTLTLALKAAIAAHDIGKLSTGWQDWTRRWQTQQAEAYPDLLWNGAEGERRVTPQPSGRFCAHTDFHPRYDEARNKAMLGRPRPPHASESASVLEAAFADTLFDLIPDKEQAASVIDGIVGAVCRHHSANSKGETEGWRLDPGAAHELAAVFRNLTGYPLSQDVLKRFQQEGVPACRDPHLPRADDDLAWLTYSLASRALRLGDSNSFERTGREA